MKSSFMYIGVAPCPNLQQAAELRLGILTNLVPIVVPILVAAGRLGIYGCRIQGVVRFLDGSSSVQWPSILRAMACVSAHAAAEKS